MKKTLTVLCLMIAVAGAGQYPIYNRLPLDTTIAPKYDTIPIIYLYADTTTFEAFGAKQRNPITYWDFGYEVISDGDFLGYTVHPITGVLKPVYERKSIGYLDRQKNPIRKSMIIWQTKTKKHE